MIKIGIIREGKFPPDARVPLTPKQCQHIQTQQNNVEIKVATSPDRCYKDDEYQQHGFELQTNLNDCDILMGVKEVPIDQLVPNKTYFFFSHTIKKQSYNRDLLLAILEKNIRLLDYEVLTNEKGQRLIAFGKFAGMVGAHNALLTYGKRVGTLDLPRMKDCYDYAEAVGIYQKTDFPPVKIVLTGTGRVGQGAAQVLTDMGIAQVKPQDFLQQDYPHAVFTQLSVRDYVMPKENKTTWEIQDFYQQPQQFKSIFEPYTQVADIMINGIYWDNNAPAFFTSADMRRPDFNIKVIADVTCDIAPVSSIPSTLRASTIASPFFGYDPQTEMETVPFQAHVVDMMTIDNLPNELPRDASEAFGAQFIADILPELLTENSGVIERATVAVDGKLGPHFQYLADYVAGETV
ncbi:MAG: NAD(P)-dependent oxidoreductase [Bacteroidota bacterium]